MREMDYASLCILDVIHKLLFTSHNIHLAVSLLDIASRRLESIVSQDDAQSDGACFLLTGGPVPVSAFRGILIDTHRHPTSPGARRRPVQSYPH